MSIATLAPSPTYSKELIYDYLTDTDKKDFQSATTITYTCSQDITKYKFLDLQMWHISDSTGGGFAKVANHYYVKVPTMSSQQWPSYIPCFIATDSSTTGDIYMTRFQVAIAGNKLTLTIKLRRRLNATSVSGEAANVNRSPSIGRIYGVR